MSKKILDYWWKDYPASHIEMEESLRARIHDAFLAGAAAVFCEVVREQSEAPFAERMAAIRDEVMEAALTAEERLSNLPLLEEYKVRQ